VAYIFLSIIALLAMGLSHLPAIQSLGLSPLPIAIVLAMVAGHFMGERAPSLGEQRWIRFCQQRLLRTGIVLFGLGLTVQQVASVGWAAVLLDLLMVSGVLLLGCYIGIRVMKLPADLAILTTAGSAICGAAAILATDSVLKAKQQHVCMAVATVVLFGTTAMFLYPVFFPFSGMSEAEYGVFIGSTVHEVAQAVAAGDSVGGAALQNAVVVKLIRVMLLAPFVVTLGWYLFSSEAKESNREQRTLKGLPIPWFVFGFIAVVMINSWLLPEVASVNLLEAIRTKAHIISQLCLTLAMASLGYQTRVAILKQAGPKPMMLAAFLFIALMLGGYGLNQTLIAL
jgi:uncharacterized integral membrane protein (TIGR00698 family)